MIQGLTRKGANKRERSMSRRREVHDRKLVQQRVVAPKSKDK